MEEELNAHEVRDGHKYVVILLGAASGLKIPFHAFFPVGSKKGVDRGAHSSFPSRNEGGPSEFYYGSLVVFAKVSLFLPRRLSESIIKVQFPV